jgi:RNA-directed DNA polymerase
MSLSPQTIRRRHSIREMKRSGRKQWDLYRSLLCPFVLHDALKLVMLNHGSAGVDGQTIRSIRGKESGFVKELLSEMKAKTFQPSPVRRVYIPKKDGSQRPLGIPTLKDRVVQRALVLLLEPIYEQKFHDFSYGFRPNRRAVDAAAVVAKECYQRRYVFDADIEKFFDNVVPRKVIGILKQEIADPRVLRLIKSYFAAGVQEIGKVWERQKLGVPQGGPLSPLLANIYLHELLDEPFMKAFGKTDKVKLVRYADDFVIMVAQKCDLEYVEKHVRGWLAEGGLMLKQSKTRWIDMSNWKRGYQSKFNFLGFKFHLRSYKDNASRFWIARQPSEESRQALRAALHERLHPGLSLQVAYERLEQTWNGWCEYFRYGNSNRIFYRERKQAKKIYLWYLARKFRRQKKAVHWRVLYKWKRKLTNTLRVPNILADHLARTQKVQTL